MAVTNAQRNPWTLIYNLQTGDISTWAGSGDIDISSYDQFLVLIHVTLLTGTSIALIFSAKDNDGSYTLVRTAGTISGTGTKPYNLGPGAIQGVNDAAFYGNILNITATLTAITHLTFALDVWAR